MKRFIMAAALGAGCLLASSAPALAEAKTYDCSKAGNANKAACKEAAKDAAKATVKSKPAPKPAATNVSSTTTTRTMTEKKYDCSKAGNKTKAVCKTAAATSAKPIVKQTTVATQTRHYDCTKPGNAGKAQRKVSTSSNQMAGSPSLRPG